MKERMVTDEMLADRELREIVERYGGEGIASDPALRELAASYGGTEVVGQAAKSPFDPSLLIQAASEIAQKGVTAVQQKRAAGEATSALRAAVAADRALVDALARLAVAEVGKKEAEIAAAQAVADAARVDQEAAGAAVPQELARRRVDAANQLAAETARSWAAKPSSIPLGARARASKEVARGLVAQPMIPAGETAIAAPGGAPSTGFLARVRTGLAVRRFGLPTWGWILGSAGLGVGALFLVRRLRARGAARSPFAGSIG